MTIGLQALPPQDALAFFRSKGLAPPDQRFDFRDVWRNEHARAFVVAKAMRTDVLETLRNAVDDALANGQDLRQFTEALEPELKRLGWWGRKMVRDPMTGALEKVQLGSNRRLSVIFDANMRAAHAAGKWARIQRVKRSFPYLRYVQIQRETKRPDHVIYHQIIRQVDDPIWARIYPPNGWRCGCTIQQLSQRQLDKRGYKVTGDFVLQERGVLNKRTGEIEPTALGVDPAWDGNPGMIWAGMDRLPASGAIPSQAGFGAISNPLQFAYQSFDGAFAMEDMIASGNLGARFYNGTGYGALNRALRGHEPMTRELVGWRDDLDKTIAANSVPPETMLYRGLQRISLPDVGDRLSEKSYGSFSLSSGMAMRFAGHGNLTGISRRQSENVMLRMRVPDATSGIYLGGFENEVLLRRRLGYRVIAVQEIEFDDIDAPGQMRRIKIYDIELIQDET